MDGHGNTLVWILAIVGVVLLTLVLVGAIQV